MAQVNERIEDHILNIDSLNDDDKLYLIFNLHKDKIRQFDVHLYYALLGWKDAHIKELLNSRLVVDTLNTTIEG
jgi:hypothetical protein